MEKVDTYPIVWKFIRSRNGSFANRALNLRNFFEIGYDADNDFYSRTAVPFYESFLPFNERTNSSPVFQWRRVFRRDRKLYTCNTTFTKETISTFLFKGRSTKASLFILSTRAERLNEERDGIILRHKGYVRAFACVPKVPFPRSSFRSHLYYPRALFNRLVR